MKLKIEHILILGLAIVIILLSTCNGGDVREQRTTEIFRTDSIYTHTTDTFIEIIKVPYKSIQYVDSTKIDSTLNGYGYGGEDSLLTYSIFIETRERPIDVQLKYELKNFTISDTTYIYVRDSVYQEGEIKSFMSLGGQIIGGGNYFGVAPTLTYSHKKGNNYTLGYDVLNGNIMIGFSKKLSFRKK